MMELVNGQESTSPSTKGVDLVNVSSIFRSVIESELKNKFKGKLNQSEIKLKSLNYS